MVGHARRAREAREREEQQLPRCEACGQVIQRPLSPKAALLAVGVAFVCFGLILFIIISVAFWVPGGNSFYDGINRHAGHPLWYVLGINLKFLMHFVVRAFVGGE